MQGLREHIGKTGVYLGGSGLGPLAQEGHGPVGMGPAQGHEDAQKAGAPLL